MLNSASASTLGNGLTGDMRKPNIDFHYRRFALSSDGQFPLLQCQIKLCAVNSNGMFQHANCGYRFGYDDCKSFGIGELSYTPCQTCLDLFGVWVYGTCSRSCGSGEVLLNRACTNGKFGDLGCEREKLFKTEVCNARPCCK